MDIITYKELYEIISASKKKTRKDINIDSVVSEICEKLNIKVSDVLRQKVVNDVRKYRHHQTKVRKSFGSYDADLHRIAINASDYEKQEDLNTVTDNISESTDASRGSSTGAYLDCGACCLAPQFKSPQLSLRMFLHSVVRTCSRFVYSFLTVNIHKT